MREPIAWFARNGVVANLLLLVIVGSGLYALANLKREVYAEFALDVISVGVDYRGAGPEDVEDAICVRLEEAVQGLEGIKRITSTATEGRGSMALEIESGYDVRELLEDVKTRVDAIDTLPEQVDKPIIRKMMRRFQVPLRSRAWTAAGPSTSRPRSTRRSQPAARSSAPSGRTFCRSCWLGIRA